MASEPTGTHLQRSVGSNTPKVVPKEEEESRKKEQETSARHYRKSSATATDGLARQS